MFLALGEPPTIAPKPICEGVKSLATAPSLYGSLVVTNMNWRVLMTILHNTTVAAKACLTESMEVAGNRST